MITYDTGDAYENYEIVDPAHTIPRVVDLETGQVTKLVKSEYDPPL